MKKAGLFMLTYLKYVKGASGFLMKRVFYEEASGFFELQLLAQRIKSGKHENVR